MAGGSAELRGVGGVPDPPDLFLLWCFEWQLSSWERAVTAIVPFGGLALAPGEVTARFGHHFHIDKIAGEHDLKGWPRGWSAYLMTRNDA